jgi:prolyl-tRNA synthetase
MHKEGVKEKAEELAARLKAAGLRVKTDISDNSPGWKFAEYEMKGVPLRIELGPKDIENGQCVAVRRDNGEKTAITLAELEAKAAELLDAVQSSLFEKAKANLSENTFDAVTADDIKEIVETKGGFVRTKWCGDTECELKLKEYAGVSSRCMPLEQDGKTGVCPVCGKPSETTIIWGVAY